jgi:hypothetical protein
VAPPFVKLLLLTGKGRVPALDAGMVGVVDSTALFSVLESGADVEVDGRIPVPSLIVITVYLT